MVVRSALVVAGLALSVLSFPSAQAENVADGQAFYYAPDQALASLPPEDLREPLGYPGLAGTAYHRVTLSAAAAVLPVRSSIWVEVTQPTVTPPITNPNTPVTRLCDVTLYIGVANEDDGVKGYWYYCFQLGTAGVILPGTYEFTVDWESLDRGDAVTAAPGDYVYSSVWTLGSSTPTAPTMFLLGDKQHPSLFVLEGTKEPMPGSDSAPAADTNSTTNSTATSTSGAPGSSGPTSTGTTGPKATSTAAPKPGEPGTESKAAPVREDARKSPAAIGMLHGALLIAGFAILMRRRAA
jgi:hypothetical protein